MYAITSFLLAALGGAPLSDALPWSADGHRIVCRVATTHLTAAARLEVAELIGRDPRYDRFEDACVWADEIRAEIQLGNPDLQHFARFTPSHYMNSPRGSVGVAVEDCTPDPPPGRLPSPCVLDAIAAFSDSLRRSTHPDRRLEALKFLGHFVGDLHQPLHAGYGDDRGGNDATVNVMGDPDQNMHAVWDDFFIGHRGLAWPDHATELEERITPIDRELWSGGDPVAWANESYQIVEREVYADIERDGPYVGQRYYDRHIETVERQLVKGGLRLAHLLNGLLDPNYRP